MLGANGEDWRDPMPKPLAPAGRHAGVSAHAQTTSKRAIIWWSSCSMLWQWKMNAPV